MCTFEGGGAKDGMKPYVPITETPTDCTCLSDAASCIFKSLSFKLLCLPNDIW